MAGKRDFECLIGRKEMSGGQNGSDEWSLQRQQATELLSEAVSGFLSCSGEESEWQELMGTRLWAALSAFQGVHFYTARNLAFTYMIRGNEMFVSRKDKSITRATVEIAFQRAVKLQKNEGLVSGPKKLGTFGASYLYPVFLHLGMIRSGCTDEI